MVSLFEVAVLLLCAAVSGLHVLQPILDYYLLAISLPVAYFTGLILVHLQIAPLPPVPLPPVALRLLAAMACALLLLLATMQLVPRL